MNKNILKSVILGNQLEIERVELLERDFSLDEYERMVGFIENI